MFGPKKCKTCGVVVDKESAIKRLGKYFCSEEHAKVFVAQERRKQRESSSGYSCCG